MKFKVSLFVFITIFLSTAFAVNFNKIINKSKYSTELQQDDSYDRLWKKVEEYKKAYQPKSALKVVETIYEKAKNENNNPQFLKAVLNKSALISSYEEDYLVKTIEFYKKEIKNSKGSRKAILQSVLGEMYSLYYYRNMWKFRDRTNTVNFNKNDIATWTLDDISHEAAKNYLASLRNAGLLKKISLKNYDIILHTAKNSKIYRPTLYDFLAFRALDFFTDNSLEPSVKPGKFNLSQKDFFKPFDEYIKINFPPADSLSNDYIAAKITKEILVTHLNDKNRAPLIDADLIRLQLAKNRFSNENADSLYFYALQNLYHHFENDPAVAEVLFKTAEIFYNRSRHYNPVVSQAYKWDLKKAMEICEKTVSKFPKTLAAGNCKMMMKKIKHKTFKATTENVLLPDKPAIATVKYKNIDKFYFRIVKLSRKEINNLYEKNRYSKKNILTQLANYQPYKQWETDIENDGDYQEHTTDVCIPALPSGNYFLLISAYPDFNYKYGSAYNSFSVSKLSYIYTQKNNETDVFVFDRQSGKPLKGVSVSTKYIHYNYKKRKEEEIKSDKYITNENGEVVIKTSSKNKYGRMILIIRKDDDVLISNEIYTRYWQRENTKTVKTTWFFTDRAIYRLGQTVYFKGIMIKEYDKKPEIISGEKTHVTLYNANNQKVAEGEFTTNDYGTFSGKFVLPQGGRNGVMRIANETGSKHFRVEEYKRPNFEVDFLPVKEEYKLGETVKVKGKAKTFSGVAVDGAKVKYTVIRYLRSPYFWYFTPPKTKEILTGEGITNANGEFEIKFEALPDKQNGNNNLIYNYSITAYVTDINGETQSATDRITVSNIALIVDIKAPELINTDSSLIFGISTTNPQGQFTPAKGEIKIHKLLPPDRLFRKRNAGIPDKFTMSKKEFYRLFPHDVYANEDKPENMPKQKWGYSYNFDTEKKKTADLGKFLKNANGKYLFEITSTDKYGNKIVNKRYFTFYSAKSKKMPLKKYMFFKLYNDTYEPGDTMRFILGSSAKKVNALFTLYNKGRIADRHLIKISNEKRIISIPVKEEYRGNFSFNIVFIKNNRVYKVSKIINVPYSNKKLDIGFSTFRNKILPGSKQQWQIKIKDSDSNGIAAELLASMYDASLDKFAKNNWHFNIYRKNYYLPVWTLGFFNTRIIHSTGSYLNIYYKSKEYDKLNLFDFGFALTKYGSLDGIAVKEMVEDEIYDNEITINKEALPVSSKNERSLTAISDSVYQNNEFNNTETEVQIRRNFAETAFFYPQLHTDTEGNLVLNFTAPEALTRWNLMTFAHTEDLKYGLRIHHLVTQKDLMIVPDAPRFFRENDSLVFTAKITNVSGKDLKGEARLMLFDATTMQPVDNLFGNANPSTGFAADSGRSTVVSWPIRIPEGIGAVVYRVTARSGNFTDGEEKAVPVLTNRMLVTESLPMPVRGHSTTDFTFDKLLKSSNSSTLKHQSLTLEFTSHPAWYAVQALPYLMEFPHECSEQIFSRYYANSIAAHIVNSDPKIKKVFDSWKNISPDALLSNLEKNQELKSIILEQTPWLLEGRNESERKRKIALLFDIKKMSEQRAKALNKLMKSQLKSGGWSWFRGGYASTYITQHIVTGFGHLRHLGINELQQNMKVKTTVRKAILFLDAEMKKRYDNILKYNLSTKDKKHIGSYDIQYLYARSFFIKDFPVSNKNKEAFNYFKEQARKYWTSQSTYMKGMLALAFHRFGDKKTADAIMKSLKETSLHSKETGMYWRLDRGWYWYQAPVETQALLIEAFDEVANDSKSVEEMKLWLLKQKQTNNWKTTKATAEACYALLLRGTSLLSSDKIAEVKMGGKNVEPQEDDSAAVEAGTGYFKKVWQAAEITPQMGKITVNKTDDGPGWGAVYWQYFEQLDKITTAATPLKLNKKLFVVRNAGKGTVIEPVSSGNSLKVGDRVKVRIELRVDRTMEYVHMKDMRASAFEPVNVLSKYSWQDGLGYYQSTRDASTDFFFDRLPKGTYVFEYELVVTHAGSFSNGITTIQCMYAPEFSAHSDGVKVRVLPQ